VYSHASRQLGIHSISEPFTFKRTKYQKAGSNNSVEVETIHQNQQPSVATLPDRILSSPSTSLSHIHAHEEQLFSNESVVSALDFGPSLHRTPPGHGHGLQDQSNSKEVIPHLNPILSLSAPSTGHIVVDPGDDILFPSSSHPTESGIDISPGDSFPSSSFIQTIAPVDSDETSDVRNNCV
jgi:hypothetical protein